MTDWATVASVTTAGTTLVLALATFGSVRSANRAARTAERSLLAGLRPVLFASRPDDPEEKIGWYDQHWVRVPGGQGWAEVANGNIYLAIPLRNVGTGIAVLDAWYIWPPDVEHPDEPVAIDRFRRLTRDLYVAPGGTGFFQGAIRESDDADRAPVKQLVAERSRIIIDLLYSDVEGGQRTITRFTLNPASSGVWLAAVARHWNLDRPGPR